MKISQDVGSSGPNVQVTVKQDSQPLVESSFGISLPLLPFNNRITVSMVSAAEVNLDLNKPVSEQTAFSNYEMTARVYIRQKEYPYIVYTKEPHPKIVMVNSLNVEEL